MGKEVEGSTILQPGTNPLDDPFNLFIVQVLVIVALSRSIGYVLRYLKQPRVIAEVIGGILLGKSALGRIDSFTNTIFPKSSLDGLKLVANLGLVLFLFLVGLELDVSTLFQSAKKAASISIAGILFPFIISLGTSKALYDLIMVPFLATTVKQVDFTTFAIFTGVAMSITAFPVLARILSERKLMHTKVGQLTIASAAVDDVVAWVLLIIVIALVNNTGEYIKALYVFLVTIAWSAFLLFAIRPLFRRMVLSTSHKDQISQMAVFLTFIMLLISAWFTQVIGVHAIFGAFLAGLSIPHEHSFAIKVAEKIEDLVSIVFLPLYFAFAGLNTRLDKLDTGLVWGMAFLVIATACVGKILGCFIACKTSKLDNRESLAVAVLMNTKGLIEIIVLNIGLNAGVINDVVFTIMVLMALVTTFMTSPLIALVYPPHKQTRPLRANNLTSRSNSSLPRVILEKPQQPIKVLLALRNMHNVRPMMSLLQMVSDITNEIEVIALRLLPLGDRIGMLMKAKDPQETLRADPVLDIFKTFAQLNHTAIDSMLSVAPMHDFAENIITTAEENDVNLIILSHRKQQSHFNEFEKQVTNFFDDKYNKAFIIDSVCARASCSVAVFMDNGFNVSSEEIHIPANEDTVRSIGSLRLRSVFQPQLSKVFLVFNGGADAREAVLFMLQFHRGVNVHVLLLSGSKIDEEAKDVSDNPASSTTLPEADPEFVADEDILASLRYEIDEQSKAVGARPFVDGQINMETMEYDSSIETAYAMTMQWLKSMGALKSDLVVLGRTLYEYGKDPSRHDLPSPAELCVDSSFCIVQHQPFVPAVLEGKGGKFAALRGKIEKV